MERSRVGQQRDLSQILLDGALVRPEDLAAAQEITKNTGRKLPLVLLENKFVTQETLSTVYSFQLGVPTVDLNQYKVKPEAIALIPENVAREHNVIPLSLDGDTLLVCMSDPTDMQVIDTLSVMSRKSIRPAVPLRGDINVAIDSNYRLTAKIEEQISRVVSEAQAQGRIAPEPMLAPEAISQAPVVKAVDMLLTQAVKDRASDIHLEPQEKGLKVRYRIDGILHEAVTLPPGVHNALISRIKIMANMNITEKRRSQDGQMSATIGDKQIDFRVATAETSYGEMMVIRVLDKSSSVLNVSDIGLTDNVLESYKRALQSAFGMILISGPTGSGKTTTLYASVGQLNPREQNIMSIEDPIEYHFKDINQIQVNAQAGINFASGLRAILRLDPDIILVGEVRDNETANVAINAALTGHLVLTSIHANDAIGAIIRQIDLGVEPFLVTSGVIASLSQRLVRKVCPYCRQIRTVSPEEAMAYQQEMGEVKTDFYYGRGCNFCAHTGYLGRVAVFEFLPLTDQLRSLILRRAPSAEIKTQALKEGMITMRRDGMLKARNGVTTPREVIRSVFTIG